MMLADIEYRLLSSFDFVDPKVKDYFMSIEPELRLIGQRMIDERSLVLLQYADEVHIKRWEESVQVNPAPSDLEQRRRYLQTLLVTKIKVGADSLSTLVKQFTGASNKVEFMNDESIVKVTLLSGINKSLMHQFELLLKQIIPAHLYYKIDMDYDLEASLNLANYKSGTIELEVTDQYEGYFESTGGLFESGGSVASVTFTEFTDQYHTNLALDGTAQSGTGYIHTTLFEVTDQHDVLVTSSGESYTVSTAEFIQEILID